MSRYSIHTYHKKRDFTKTPEPKGKDVSTASKALQFVIQKHDATRLHYDFRLEMDGVLKSWAVPKGPSLNPHDKRLAVRTEDHPLDYANFEGIIPEHHYGAGPVMIWDKGTWFSAEKNPLKALEKGKLVFRLEGKKLHGEWALVRMHTPKQEPQENWLLIKHQDENANQSFNIVETTDYSTQSGRSFDAIASSITEEIETLLQQYPAVQLATLVDSPPSSDEWLHEVKYDGYRIFAFVSGNDVVIRTRNGHIWTSQFPHLAEALARIQRGTFIIDGEALVINDQGLSDFKALQNSLGNSKAPMQAYFFDLLYWNGQDYSALPLKERRKALKKLCDAFPNNGPLFLSEAIPGNAHTIIEHACQLGLEGIVSKKLEAPYVTGRGKSWVKSKCGKRQEFIICGFIEASHLSQAIGALHLGYYDGGKLVYGGKVGTGFDHKSAKFLYQKLYPLTRPTHPFIKKPEGNFKNTVWVEPQLLCEVKFGVWTETGKLRHASYQGLREDKAPEEISKEEPKSLKRIKTSSYQVHGITISHADRIIFPDASLTKGKLAEFYSKMSEYILPLIENRPISIVRCPEGITKECFFQRTKGKGMPEHIHRFEVMHKDKPGDYMYINSTEGLIEFVQMGAIEIHPWGAKIDNIEEPDRIIFDLDPDENVPFEAVKLAALDIRQRFKKRGLDSFLKVTGGKGLHVTVPIVPAHSWHIVKEFAHDFVESMVRDVPEAYVSTMSKKKRTGKIFVDFFRNDYAATAVMEYSVRSRPGASVAVPLFWDELDTLHTANQFHIQDVLSREKQAKIWLEQYIRTHQKL
ncbi:MAG: ATP-dependent ligase [Rickettsiales bacterium]|jgi:bifunctional non-homologous end joining protein LigD|nr:ATP-dependent ligase [Rickettsiales bacterium]